MAVLFKLSLFTILFVYCEAQVRKEFYMPVAKLIQSEGYPVEKHRVTTEDGYMLQLQRIPAGRRSARRSGEPTAKNKKAVLIIHGLLGSSGDFIIMGPERSLGYLLADAGYDVWLGNLRGNDYSAHKTLKKTDPKFWEFSFHEHGKYDIPATIDKILNITGLEKIMYVGYSMGTTSFFVMMSEKPEYNDKLIAAVEMAPAVYMDNVRFVADFLLKSTNLPNTLRERGMIFLNPVLMKTLTATFCNLNDLDPENDPCIRTVNAIVGEDDDQIDMDILPAFFNRIQPASFRQLEHFGKIAITGVFTTWDGSLSSAVRPYKISNVRIPTTLLYGENDQLTRKSHIMRLAQQLNETGFLESVQPVGPWPKFNHLDFVFAKDVAKLVNKPLIRHIDYLYNKYGTV